MNIYMVIVGVLLFITNFIFLLVNIDRPVWMVTNMVGMGASIITVVLGAESK